LSGLGQFPRNIFSIALVLAVFTSQSHRWF